MRFLKFLFFIFLVEYTFASNIVLSQREDIFRIPEEYFNDQIAYIAEDLYSSGIKNVKFYINEQKLIISGKYRSMPFKIYFVILKRSEDIFQIYIEDFLFFNFVKYSKRKLISMLYSSLKDNADIEYYAKLALDNDKFIIKLKKPLNKIFPETFLHKTK